MIQSDILPIHLGKTSLQRNDCDRVRSLKKAFFVLMLVSFKYRDCVFFQVENIRLFKVSFFAQVRIRRFFPFSRERLKARFGHFCAIVNGFVISCRESLEKCLFTLKLCTNTQGFSDLIPGVFRLDTGGFRGRGILWTRQTCHFFL